MSNLFKVITATTVFNANANDYFRINFNPEIPQGYEALGVIEWSTGTSIAVPSAVTISQIEGRNVNSISISNMKATIKILCMRII